MERDGSLNHSFSQMGNLPSLPSPTLISRTPSLTAASWVYEAVCRGHSADTLDCAATRLLNCCSWLPCAALNVTKAESDTERRNIFFCLLFFPAASSFFFLSSPQLNGSLFWPREACSITVVWVALPPFDKLSDERRRRGIGWRPPSSRLKHFALSPVC